MGRLFVTSDLHLGHGNIIKYCNRPFRDLEHMDSEIIRRWNERVEKDDTVIVAGDFCFTNSPGGKLGEGTTNGPRYYREMLNGQIVLLKGNHDRNNKSNTHIRSLVLDFGRQDYFVTHRPQDRDVMYKYNIVGHVHEKWLFKKEDHAPSLQPGKGFVYLLNVGVDKHNFYPLPMTEVVRLFNKIEKGHIKC